MTAAAEVQKNDTPASANLRGAFRRLHHAVCAGRTCRTCSGSTRRRAQIAGLARTQERGQATSGSRGCAAHESGAELDRLALDFGSGRHGAVSAQQKEARAPGPTRAAA